MSVPARDGKNYAVFSIKKFRGNRFQSCGRERNFFAECYLKKERKVLITTVQFYPDPTPRANRVFELARGFSRRGWKVEVFLLWDDRDRHRHESLFLEYGIKVDYLTRFVVPRENDGKPFSTVREKIQRLFNRVICRIFGFPRKPYPYHLLPGIILKLTLKLLKEPALFIAVSNPVYAVFFSAICLKFFPGRKFTAVAEYGDPVLPARRFENREAGKAFDRFVIMREEARDWCRSFTENKNIFVIPHAFDFSEVRKAVYKKEALPSFAYAGRFWKGVRDPRFFLEFLSELKQDFRFYIYWNHVEKVSEDPDWIKDLLKQFQRRLGERLILKEPLPRLELIYELSQRDFLIDFSNITVLQAPSKVVDYALAERPVLSIHEDTFKPQIFNDFLKGDYTQSLKVDLSKHNIHQAIDEYLKAAGLIPDDLPGKPETRNMNPSARVEF